MSTLSENQLSLKGDKIGATIIRFVHSGLESLWNIVVTSSGTARELAKLIIYIPENAQDKFRTANSMDSLQATNCQELHRTDFE